MRGAVRIDFSRTTSADNLHRFAAAEPRRRVFAFALGIRAIVSANMNPRANGIPSRFTSWLSFAGEEAGTRDDRINRLIN